MCSFITFSIPYLGHCGSNSSREFQSLSFLLQLLQENIEATSQLLLCPHQKMSTRGPIKIFVLLQFPFCSLKPLVWNFCFPALPTCSLIFKEHPAMQLHCSTASGHMVSSVWKHPVMLVLMGLPRGCGPESSRLFFHNAFFFFFFPPNWNAEASINCLREYLTDRWSKMVPPAFWASAAHKRCLCPRILRSRGLIADANHCHRCQPWDRLRNVSYFHFISENHLGKVPFDNAVASRTILILHTVLFFTPQIKTFSFVSFIIYSWHRKAGRGSR